MLPAPPWIIRRGLMEGGLMYSIFGDEFGAWSWMNGTKGGRERERR